MANRDRFGQTVFIKRGDAFGVGDGGDEPSLVCGIKLSAPTLKVGKAPGLFSGSPGSSVGTSVA